MQNAKKIKVALLDFDGTLVSRDILDILCGVMGKKDESSGLNEAFHRGEVPGLEALVTRINFLSGMSIDQITEVLQENNYLLPGAIELIDLFRQNQIITILASGNIIPVLEYYQKLLGITHIVGPQPIVDRGVIIGIDESTFYGNTFKVDSINQILLRYDVDKENIIALGDSPSDRGMFDMSSFSIAVNPKGNIAASADVSISEDLNEAIIILKEMIGG